MCLVLFLLILSLPSLNLTVSGWVINSLTWRFIKTVFFFLRLKITQTKPTNKTKQTNQTNQNQNQKYKPRQQPSKRIKIRPKKPFKIFLCPQIIGVKEFNWPSSIVVCVFALGGGISYFVSFLFLSLFLFPFLSFFLPSQSKKNQTTAGCPQRGQRTVNK